MVDDDAPAAEDRRSTARSAEDSGDVERDAALEALWARVLAAWDDDKPHAAILEYALRTERLADVAGRYRALADDPAKGERAKRRIDAIVAAATQLLFATKTTARPRTPKWLTWVAAAMFVGAAMWAAWTIGHR